MAQIRSIVFVVLLVAFVSLSLAEDSSDLLPEKDDPLPLLARKPRFIKVHSRLHPGAEYEKGIGFKGHLMNVLKGGSIGVEFQMPEKFAELIKNLKNKFAYRDKSDLNREKNSDEGEEREWVDFTKLKRREDDYGLLINPRNPK